MRRKLLTYFFSNPEAALYVREIAYILKEDPGNLSRELSRLEKEGIFISQSRGRQKHYSLNKNYPLFKEMKSIIFKTVGIEGSLRSVLSDVAGIEVAFIYGSYAKKKETATSDIDLFIIGSPDEGKLVNIIEKLEKQLGREINYTIYPLREFTEKRQSDSFIMKIMKGPKIILRGNP